MDLLQIGIVVLGWFAVSAFVVAIAAAAGRADRRETRQRLRSRDTTTPQLFPDPQPLRIRARRVRTSARVHSDRRLRATIH